MLNRTALALVPVAVLAIGTGALADQVVISSKNDSTLYQSPDGAIGNGSGDGFFVGKTNGGSLRRGVISFDIASAVPAGSTITSVTLKLRMSRTTGSSSTINLYRLTNSWGEGISAAQGNGGAGTTSENDDATWLHRFYPGTLWTNQGGDFVSTSSGNRAVAGTNFYTWGSTTQMAADVQSWLDNPAQNFGWILIGNEASNRTTKRFDSRQNATVANRPVLTVTYTPPPPVCTADWDHDGTLTPADVALFVNDWYQSLSQGTLIGDYDHSGTVNSVDIALFVNDWFAQLNAGC